MFTPILDLEVITKATVLRFTDVTGPDTILNSGTKWDGVSGVSSALVSLAELTVTDPNGTAYSSDITAYINAAWPVTDDIVFGDISGMWTDGFYTVVYDVHMTAANILQFADYGAGRVKITALAHSVVSGMKVTIAGTSFYNGIYDATYINANEFYIVATYVVEAPAGTITPFYSNSFSPFVFANVEMAIDRMLAVFCNMDEGPDGDDYLKQVQFLQGLLMGLRSAIMTTTVARINNIYGRITRILDFNDIELTYT